MTDNYNNEWSWIDPSWDSPAEYVQKVQTLTSDFMLEKFAFSRQLADKAANDLIAVYQENEILPKVD